ncbi:YtxH domain-containing protein [Aquimarina sp. W85]|uniref:YtxH domain-containing protein n=1 Tax=Aquimarina rhodophyticola TaxID=3342246 RepID=UPI00366F9005
MSNRSNTVLGILSAAAVGTAIGILFAPDKGKNTRTKIQKKAVDTKDDIMDKANAFSTEINSRFTSKKAEFENELDGLVSNMSVKADDVITSLEKKLDTLKKRNEVISSN